jgi:hypothetical protein
VRSLVVLALGIALVATGCSGSSPKWVDKGASYTPANVVGLYPNADISNLSAVSASDIAKRRHAALAALRKHGKSASAAADLITKTLPSDSRGVPVYVEQAMFDGTPSLIVIEAIGPPNQKMTMKRLWVLAEDGSVKFVGTR